METCELGEKIRGIRIEKNLKLESVAKKAGMSATGYGNFERGKTNSISFARLFKITRALEISFVELLPVEITNLISIEEHNFIIRKYRELLYQKDREITTLHHLLAKKSNPISLI